MVIYATMVQLSAEEVTGMSNAKKLLEEVPGIAGELGIKIIGNYATLGPYDVMLIYEAPDEKTAACMSMSVTSKLGGRPETWTLIPADEVPKIVQMRKR